MSSAKSVIEKAVILRPCEKKKKRKKRKRKRKRLNNGATLQIRILVKYCACLKKHIGVLDRRN